MSSSTSPSISSHSHPCPIPTFKSSSKVQDVNTDVLIQVYSDKVLVVVSQMGGRAGVWLQITLPTPSTSTSTDPPPQSQPLHPSLESLKLPPSFRSIPPSSIAISSLLGLPTPTDELYSAQIAGFITSPRPSVDDENNSGEAGGEGRNVDADEWANGADLMGDDFDPDLQTEGKPVVVGLGLKRLPSNSSKPSQVTMGDEDVVDQSEEVPTEEELELERDRFVKILELVGKCWDDGRRDKKKEKEAIRQRARGRMGETKGI